MISGHIYKDEMPWRGAKLEGLKKQLANANDIGEKDGRNGEGQRNKHNWEGSREKFTMILHPVLTELLLEATVPEVAAPRICRYLIEVRTRTPGATSSFCHWPAV